MVNFQMLYWGDLGLREAVEPDCRGFALIGETVSGIRGVVRRSL